MYRGLSHTAILWENDGSENVFPFTYSGFGYVDFPVQGSNGYFTWWFKMGGCMIYVIEFQSHQIKW